MKARARLLLIFMIVSLAIPASAVVFVSTTGDDGNNGLSWGQAKRHIQAGADLAATQTDKTVWVAKNTVLVPAYVENINVPVGVLIYGGFDGTEDPLTFNLDNRVFVPETVIQPAATITSILTTLGSNRIDGFTIQGGGALLGAGIFATSATSLMVSNCIFYTNTAHYGGGIYSTNGYVSVSKTLFSNDNAVDSVGNPNAYGGAIYTLDSTLNVSDCSFTGDNAAVYLFNNVTAKGGAIYAEGGAVVTIQRSKFSLCHAWGGPAMTRYAYGGAIYIKSTDAIIRNNMIYKCGASGAGDTETSYGGGIAFENPGVPSIINNTFYGDEVTPNAGLVTDIDRPYGMGAAIYLSGSGPANILNNIITQSRGTAVVNEGMSINFNYNLLWHNAGGDKFGFNFPFYSVNPALNKDFNIMKDPQFYDKYNNDFHITVGSPARNAGYVGAGAGSLDFDNEPRIIAGKIDIGADEFTDVDNDGGANIIDPQPNIFNLPDTDLDGVSDIFDNCPGTSNTDQLDSNGDGTGDVCTPLSTGATPYAYYVDGTVASSGDGTTWGSAFKTIQEGIDAADSHNQAGWTQNYAVWVRGGPATQTYFENILIWHGVAVYGAWSGNPISPTDSPSPYPLRDVNTNQTSINGSALTSDAVIAHLPQDRYLADPLKTLYDGTHSVLDSFRLTNGKAELGGGVSIYKEFADVSTCRINDNNAALGGGVYLYNSSAIVGDGLTPPPATLLSGDTTIYNNIATGAISYAGYGGGIYAEMGSPIIFANLIEGNLAFFGGGIASRASAPVIVENLIGCQTSPNIAIGAGVGNGKGGGIYLDNASDAAMNKLTIVSNNAAGAQGQGGGIYLDDSNFTLKNSIVAYNTATNPVPALNGGAIFATGTTPVTTDPWCWINYTDFFNNSLSQFVGLPDPTGPSPIPLICPLTNLAVDPLFMNPAICNYRLNVGSPLLGAGDPADGSPNMGAFQEIDPPVTIGEAKKLGNGVIVEISGVVVTAVFDDGFYVQSVDRISGIKVRTYSPGVSVGQMVNVTGVMTSTGIEREIMNPEVTILPAPAVELVPLSLTNKALGGGASGGQPGVWGWEISNDSNGNSVRKWKPAAGLNNIGLLVKTWGKVTKIVKQNRTYIVISDGSLNDVRVYLPDGIEPPAEGVMVTVTGISIAAVDDNNSTIRAIRARTKSDIVYPQ